MKKAISRNLLVSLLVTSLVVLCLVFTSVNASAAEPTASGECGVSLTWEYYADTGELKLLGSGNTGNFSAGAAPWNTYAANIKTITILEGVTGIGNFAFYNCSGVTTISIPNGVTSIGLHAFGGCTGLESLSIPASVTSLDSAFYGMPNLESITVDEGNTVYYSEGNCVIKEASMTLVLGCKNSVIPDDVKSIGGLAFRACSTLASVKIPSTVTSIGTYAFYQCSSLVTVDIPNGVTSIVSNAFRACTSLESVSIPDSVTSIGDAAFFESNKLSSVTVPHSVETLGTNAFAKGTKINCHEGSAAQTYASKNGNTVAIICAFDQEVASDDYFNSEATCTEKSTYYKSCVCGNTSKGTASEATFEDGDVLGHIGGTATCTEQAVCERCEQPYGETLKHTYDQEIAEDAYLKIEGSNAYYKSCVCGASSEGTEDEATFEYGDMHEHTYDQANVEESYLKDEKTCTTAAVYYRSCECGASSEGTEDEATFEYGKPAPHNYEWTSETELTCQAGCEDVIEAVAVTEEITATGNVASLEAADGTELKLPGGTRLEAVKLALEEFEAAAAEIKAAVGEEYKITSVIDITLQVTVGGEDVEIQPNGSVRVTVAKPAGRYASYFVICILDDGTIEKDGGDIKRYPVTVSGNSLTFETNHFTNYSVVAEEQEEEENVPIRPVHSHKYDSTWKNDAESHWLDCECGRKTESAAHTFGEWTVIKEATAEETGERVQKCIICKYENKEEIAKLEVVEDPTEPEETTAPVEDPADPAETTAPVTEPTTPAVTTPGATAPADETTSFAWIWIVIAACVCVAVVIIIVSKKKKA